MSSNLALNAKLVMFGDQSLRPAVRDDMPLRERATEKQGSPTRLPIGIGTDGLFLSRTIQRTARVSDPGTLLSSTLALLLALLSVTVPGWWAFMDLHASPPTCCPQCLSKNYKNDGFAIPCRLWFPPLQQLQYHRTTQEHQLHSLAERAFDSEYWNTPRPQTRFT
ncbi:hypothetical protein AC579_6239 [Pseudocercospora musae]|uniref:Uncharacterized protein n=1 Tax=Pseudocercospora musae TaxID=113226 RepID=A0A139HN25_9PEZI|nr:hypothetical protein AC579_6239 [Pseudocercospora musae]